MDFKEFRVYLDVDVVLYLLFVLLYQRGMNDYCMEVNVVELSVLKEIFVVDEKVIVEYEWVF